MGHTRSSFASGILIRRRQLSLALIASLSLAACPLKGAEVHLIPEGFTGPVVIVYAIPGGVVSGRDSNGAMVFRIPRSGILLTNAQARGAGWHSLSYFFLNDTNGTRAALPHPGADPVDPRRLQVFGAGSGVTAKVDGRDDIRYQYYVVGSPAEMPNWGESLEAAIERAVQQSRSLRSTGAPP